ncbi:unnamed protein product [Effrenium voratum]|uniref:EF-hand domain-containing protein n=1 Tax=Effrenium voratum TaxID=2562239 RepID=A0AA36HXC5_9DINO|nr:unnamed protein product [Effrenium voratum]
MAEHVVDGDVQPVGMAQPLVRQGSHGRSRVFLDAEEMKQKVKEALAKPSYNVFDFYHRTGFFQWLAKSSIFESLTLGVIGLNALWLAYDTNSNNADSLLTARLEFQIAEIFFCTYYTMEWYIRFMAFERKCNTMRDGWFVFDSILVFLMVGETVVMTLLMLIMGPGGPISMDLGNASILRLFRLLRLSRMARMLRSMPELMILIKGMAAATTSVFFIMCLQLILLYVFAIAFTQLAAGTQMGAYYFPNVLHSMYTLLLYGTFLDNLADFCDGVAAESSLCLALVFVFVLLSACTVLNMLIGILCEVVSAVTAVEKEEMTVLFVTNKLQRVLKKLDKNNDGHLCKDEFMKILEEPEAARALEEVGVDPVSVVDFADFIFGQDDEEGSENLSFSKFMEILLTLRQDNKATIRDMISLRSHVKGQLDKLVNQLCREVPQMSPRSLKAHHTGGEGSLLLRDDAQFVFGGDAVDHYSGDLRILEDLLTLKKQYSDRVHFVIGNRDVNKLRLPFELSERFISTWPLQEHPGVYWLEEEDRPKNCIPEAGNHAAEHLKWILARTMGAPRAFERRREELQRGGAEVDDAAVVQSFVQEARPGGLLFEYLTLAELAVKVGDSLFVHGGLPRSGLEWRPGWLPPSGESLPLDAWLQGLADFKSRQLAQILEPGPGPLPEDSWSMRGGYDHPQPGAALMQYMMRDLPDGSRQPSIIYNGFLGDDYQPLELDASSRQWLREGGVRRVVAGHLPHGDSPLILVYEDITVITADISYASEVVWEAEDETSRDQAVCEVLLGEEGRVHGALATGCPFEARLDDPLLGTLRGEHAEWRVKGRADGRLILSKNDKWDFTCRLE